MCSALPLQNEGITVRKDIIFEVENLTIVLILVGSQAQTGLAGTFSAHIGPESSM